MSVSCINRDMAKIIEQYKTELKDSGIKKLSKESSEWFTEKMEALRTPINRRNLQSEVMALNGIKAPHIGRMYMFFYVPKGIQTLPYYDMFPVVILMKIEREYFQGMNLHYLPLDLRQELLVNLQERVNNRSYNKQTFLRIDYDYLSSYRRYRAFKPCYKTYSLGNVRGRVVNVPSSEWEVVANLPCSQFRKKPEDLVHVDSRKAYRMMQ